MTACVNNEGLSGKKVVSATLAGVLAAGMVPAIAFADEAAEATPDEGIDLLSMTTYEAFMKGKVTAAKIDGKVTTELNKVQIRYDGEKHIVDPTQVTPAESDAIDIAGNKDYTVAVYAADESWTVDTSDVVEPQERGNYVARVTANKVLKDGTPAYVDLKFSIVASSLDGVTVYNKADSNTDTSKTEFTYDASAQEIGFALKGEPLSDQKYEVKYRKVGGSAVLDSAPVDAGEYTAIITGKIGSEYEKSTASVNLTIGTLDLSKARIVMSDQINEGVPALVSINDVPAGAASDLGKAVVVSFKSVSADGHVYTYSVAGAANNKSIVGSQDVTVEKVEKAATFKYNDGSQDVEWENVKTEYNLADDEFFNVKNIKVYNDSTEIDSKNYTVTVTDADGNAATVADLKKPGTWVVNVKVKAAAEDYKVGGSESIKITNIAGALESADVIVKYQGKVTSPIVVTYDGNDIMKDIEVIVKDSDGNTLKEGTDYKVKFTNTTSGKEVKEIVNADSYSITVTGITYNFGAGKTDVTNVTVNKMELKQDQGQIRFAGYSEYKDVNGDPQKFYPFTGEAVVPMFEYTTDETPDKDSVWKALPTEMYKVSYKFDGKTVAEMNKVGKYEVTLTSADDNHDITFTDSIEIADKKVFGDVSSTDWYYNPVYKAVGLEYMFGYKDGNLFGANHTITRADVVCVLYNMAGGENDVFDAIVGYDSFLDVDRSTYYAKALSWAKGLGIANGYADGTFNPEGAITRQDFACLLANYAKKVGNFKAPDHIDAVLAKYPDGAQVAEYAKENVAWACDKKIMGNGGVINPAANITRAEVAAMVVNYQPNGKLQA